VVEESPKSERSAESLVEGVVPSKSKRQMATVPNQIPGNMPDLPRIRVRLFLELKEMPVPPR
jgi:hypothetical protein